MLALNPAIGEVDVALATELLEAGRMIFNGFVTPDRTTLIASTHRVLAIGERMAMGDGSFDVGRLLRAVKERSKEQILFDMDQAAEESGGVINAVLLGALAGSGRLPIPDAAFEAAIRHGGKAVDTNLAAFAFGRGHARGELAQVVREHRKRQAAARGVEDLLERARGALSGDQPRRGRGGHSPPHGLPASLVRRAVPRPARQVHAGLGRAAARDGAASRRAHVVRGRDPRRPGQDLGRALGARARRGARQGPRAGGDHRAFQARHRGDRRHPAAALARRLLAWGERTGRLGKTYFSMHVRTTTILGFARLRLVAGLRWWRPRTYRFVEEQAEIERWLDADPRRRAASTSTWRARSPNAPA